MQVLRAERVTKAGGTNRVGGKKHDDLDGTGEKNDSRNDVGGGLVISLRNHCIQGEAPELYLWTPYRLVAAIRRNFRRGRLRCLSIAR